METLQVTQLDKQNEHMTMKTLIARTPLIIVTFSPKRRWRRCEYRYEQVDAQKPWFKGWLVWVGRWRLFQCSDDKRNDQSGLVVLCATSIIPATRYLYQNVDAWHCLATWQERASGRTAPRFS
jgi:hypothetical protein